MLCYRGTSFLTLKNWGNSSMSGLVHLVGLIRVRARLRNSWIEWCKWWYRTVCISANWRHSVSEGSPGIRWYDFIRNTKVSSRTALSPVSHRIAMGRIVILVTWRCYQTALRYTRASLAFSRPTSTLNLETSTRSSVRQVDPSAPPGQQ